MKILAIKKYPYNLYEDIYDITLEDNGTISTFSVTKENKWGSIKKKPFLGHYIDVIETINNEATIRNYVCDDQSRESAIAEVKKRHLEIYWNGDEKEFTKQTITYLHIHRQVDETNDYVAWTGEQGGKSQ